VGHESTKIGLGAQNGSRRYMKVEVGVANSSGAVSRLSQYLAAAARKRKLHRAQTKRTCAHVEVW
jgi:hypothetical protein